MLCSPQKNKVGLWWDKCALNGVPMQPQVISNCDWSLGCSEKDLIFLLLVEAADVNHVSGGYFEPGNMQSWEHIIEIGLLCSMSPIVYSSLYNLISTWWLIFAAVNCLLGAKFLLESLLGYFHLDPTERTFNQNIWIFSCDQAALWTAFSVRLPVRHTFFTMFPSSYHHEMFRSYYHWPMWGP